MTGPLLDRDDDDFQDDADGGVVLDDTDDAITAPEASDSDDSADDTADIDPDATPDQPTTPEPAAPTAGAPSSSATPAPEPLTVRAHGKVLPIEGATMTAQGITFANDAARQRVTALLSRGHEMEVFGRPRIRQLEYSVQELTESRSQAEVHANVILETLAGIVENPALLVEAVENFAQFRPMLEAKVERAMGQHERKAWERQQRAQQPTPQEQYAMAVEQSRDVGRQLLSELAPTHGLSAVEIELIGKRLLRKPENYLIDVNGTLAFDDDTFAADVADEAQARQATRQQVQTATTAATKNAAMKAGTIPAAVKAPPAKVSPTEQPRDGRTGKFKSKEEWEAWGRGER